MKRLNRVSPFGLVLIVLGAFLIGYPIYGSLTTKAAVEKFNTEWENARAELPDTQTGLEEADPTASIGAETVVADMTVSTQPAPPAVTVKKTGGPPPVGRIVIPKIELAAPIAEGVGLDVLRYAVGRLEGSAALGAIGNSVLAGHRSYTYGEFFNRLDEVKIGDTIKLETMKEDFDYNVVEVKVVEPTDLSVLDETAPKSVLTLITCTPQYSSRYRLIVIAEQTGHTAVHRD